MDAVNNPSHYQAPLSDHTKIVRGAVFQDVDPLAVECFEALCSMLSGEELIGYIRGNIFKYTWRYQQKRGIEDLQKADWYLRRLTQIQAEVESAAAQKDLPVPSQKPHRVNGHLIGMIGDFADETQMRTD